MTTLSKKAEKSPYFFLSWDNGRRDNLADGEDVVGRAVVALPTYFNLNQF